MMSDVNNDSFDSNTNGIEINIDLNTPSNSEPSVGSVEVREGNNTSNTSEPTENDGNPAVTTDNQNRTVDGAQQPHNNNANNNNTNNNQFGTVRDRLFHAMLVRVALKYSSRVSLFSRILIESLLLFVALSLLASLLFIHLKLTKIEPTCLKNVKVGDFHEGILRVEVVHNLAALEYEEQFIVNYINERLSCRNHVLNIFSYKSHADSYFPTTQEGVQQKNPIKSHTSANYSSPTFFKFSSINQTEQHTILERDAWYAWAEVSNHNLSLNYEYLYRVEYSLTYGILKLGATFKQNHNIKTSVIRIDSNSKCFGDTVSKTIMRSFTGYEDTIVACLRTISGRVVTLNNVPVIGFLNDLMTNDLYHFVPNEYGKSSYITALILMLIFTFAISMLLRFSHHQIFIFIIDLLHMFELQQPLSLPLAPIFTVILALVGMEAIMSEVFNDTTTAFYVILIVWIADQYEAICCQSPVSKRFWLRFFYVYHYFFYAYQYRFGGQYGSLALLTSSVFILHSMVYFFHHYEMPLILYQDRVSQVLADLHAPANGMGTVEVQTITVAVHNRQGPLHPENQTEGDSNERVDDNTAETINIRLPESILMEPLSPSSVFDARGPVLTPTNELNVLSTPPVEDDEPRNPEEIVAHRIVNDAMNELFHSE